MERLALSDELDVSRLIYGMWRLGDDTDHSPKHVQAKIEACLEQGITTFDQADIYGDYSSEALLGGALKAAPALRAQMQIITKCDIMLLSGRYPERKVKHYDTSAAHLQASVEASLQNMNIETIDLLLLHRPDPLMDHKETGACLDTLVASGKVRTVGVSNFNPFDWELLQSAMQNRLVTNQIEISLLAHEPFTDGSLAFLQQRGVKPMAWSPLTGGALVSQDEKTPTELQAALKDMSAEHGVSESTMAIAWLLKHPANILPVLGTNRLERIRELSSAVSVELGREEWFVLYQAARGVEVD